MPESLTDAYPKTDFFIDSRFKLINNSNRGLKMTIQNEKGFTLLEIIMAISILTIGILAVASMQAAALRGDSFAQDRTEGATWGQDKMEEYMSIPFDDSRLNVGSTETTTPSNYTVIVNVADGPVGNTRLITITVQNQQGRQINQLSCVRSELFD